MSVIWYTEKGREIRADFTFNEKEIISSFNEMASKTSEPFVLHIDIDHQENKALYSTVLKSGDIIVPINKTVVENS